MLLQHNISKRVWLPALKDRQDLTPAYLRLWLRSVLLQTLAAVLSTRVLAVDVSYVIPDAC